MSTQTHANAGASGQFKPADLVVHHKDAGYWSAYRSGEERGEIPDHAVGGTRDDPPPSHGKD